MEMWEKDPLDDFVQTFMVSLSPSKELPEAIHDFQIFRDDALNIIMQVRSHRDARPATGTTPLGTVYTLDNRIELKGILGAGTLHRVALFTTASKLADKNPNNATTSKYKITDINYTLSDDPINYTIDRIANLPSNYIWPDLSITKVIGTQETFFSGSPSITINRSLPSQQTHARNCVRINFGEHLAIIGTIKSKNDSTSKNPGYIYYCGNPDKVTREKIRASLSFALGIPLVHLSSCFYNETGGLIGFESTSAATMGGRAWGLVSQPFSPITSHSPDILDSNLLQALAVGFFDNYERMNLRTFIYRLWNAEISPSYMRAAYYGAMIESIQTQETNKPGSKICGTIIEKSDYKKTIRTLTRLLNKQKIPVQAKTLLLRKIEGGNAAPQRVLAERFYSTLGLSLGPLETEAWNKRNDAAHGTEPTPGTEIESYRLTKVLRVTLARIVIKLLQGSDFYIDYYSLTHPIRRLEDAIVAASEQP
jgi:hypothetical protein